MSQTTIGESAIVHAEVRCLPAIPLEPRCRVCRNDVLRPKIHALLAAGASYAMILRAIEDDNAGLDPRDRITIDSLRNHTRRHFAVQDVARATYREILERRARENGIDFVEGVGTALTPVAFLETVMTKAYSSLVDADTTVDVNTGMAAAGRLQAYLDTHSSQTTMTEVLAKQNKIVAAVRDLLPAEKVPELMARLRGLDQPGTAHHAGGIEEFDPGDEVFDDEDD